MTRRLERLHTALLIALFLQLVAIAATALILTPQGWVATPVPLWQAGAILVTAVTVQGLGAWLTARARRHYGSSAEPWA